MVVESEFSDRLWLEHSLGQGEQFPIESSKEDKYTCGTVQFVGECSYFNG